MTIAANIVLLLVRIVLTVTFLAESRHKFKDLPAFAKNDGLPLWLAGFVAVAELCAALSMMSGILSFWAGIGLVVLMMCTIGLHIFKWRSAYWASKRGWEYDLLMLVLAAVIVVFGAGDFSLVV